MQFATRAKGALNHLLRLANIRVETLTADRTEAERLQALERRGHFGKAVFPLLPQFAACNPMPILQQVKRDEPKFTELINNENGFSLKNDYYTTPDAEVLYAFVQLYRPTKIVEVGSGYSTQLFRRAIEDAKLDTELISIDPRPRREIQDYSDRIIGEPVEDLSDRSFFEQLRENDILFIDSSHEIKAGNDVVWLLLSVLPTLRPGVILHLHDIFLPYEYPRRWLIEEGWNWTEQYLVQALLAAGESFTVLWPGHYLQKHQPDFKNWFAQWRNADAKSLWLRKN